MMLAVYLEHHRAEFIEWRMKHLVECRELFDIAQLTDAYDAILLDGSEVPPDFKGKVLQYDSEPLDKLLEGRECFHVHVVPYVVPDSLLLNTIDIAYKTECNRTPDTEVFIEIPQSVPERVSSPVTVVQTGSKRVQKPLELSPEDFEQVERVEPEQVEQVEQVEPEQVEHAERVEPPSYIEYPEHSLTGLPQTNPQAEHSSSGLPQTNPQAEHSSSGLPQTNPQTHLQPRTDNFGSMKLATRPKQNLQISHNGISGIRSQRQAVSSMTKVVYLYGITPRSGTSTLAYMYANYLASVQQSKHVLLIDLDVASPSLTRMLMDSHGLNQHSDCNIFNLATLSTDEFRESKSMLIEDVILTSTTGTESTLSLILHDTTSFQDKRLLAAFNFSEKIEMLKDFFDYIIVDCGKLISSMDYQLHSLSAVDSKLFVVDGSTRETVLQFVQDINSLTLDYQVVMCKTGRNMTSAAISRQLGKQVIASFPQKNTIWHALASGKSILDIQDQGVLKALEQLLGGL
ncbi:MAG: AAA family ATPase [Clostridia bacterium]